MTNLNDKIDSQILLQLTSHIGSNFHPNVNTHIWFQLDSRLWIDLISHNLHSDIISIIYDYLN